MSHRYPFPLPFGWFCVGYPEEFPVGEARPLYYWARHLVGCLLYTSPSPRDRQKSRMPSSA